MIAIGQPVEFTILHTNDWQSHFLGFGPNAECASVSPILKGGLCECAEFREEKARPHSHD